MLFPIYLPHNMNFENPLSAQARANITWKRAMQNLQCIPEHLIIAKNNHQSESSQG